MVKKTASKASSAKRRSPAKRKPKGAPKPRGLAVAEIASGQPPAKVRALQLELERDGGAVLGRYREPLSGTWVLLAALPIELVRPTPYQRDLSKAHVERMTQAIGTLDRYLDPIIVVRGTDGGYWTPNGHHRTEAMRRLGARSIIALVVPEAEMAYKILALNTEKSHNLREKSLEVARMARDLAKLDPRPERDFALEFEEAPFLTLGLCYEQRPRFAGGAYHPVLRRIDSFQNAPIPRALELRTKRAGLLFELDDLVTAAVASLKERGFESPYLHAFVVARINPLRFQRGAKAPFEGTLQRMIELAKSFDAAKVRSDQVARAAGPPPEEG